MQNSITELIYSLQLSIEEERALILSVSKVLNFEQQIVLEEFDKAAEQEIHSRQEEVKSIVKEEIGQIS